MVITRHEVKAGPSVGATERLGLQRGRPRALARLRRGCSVRRVRLAERGRLWRCPKQAHTKSHACLSTQLSSQEHGRPPGFLGLLGALRLDVGIASIRARACVHPGVCWVIATSSRRWCALRGHDLLAGFSLRVCFLWLWHSTERESVGQVPAQPGEERGSRPEMEAPRPAQHVQTARPTRDIEHAET